MYRGLLTVFMLVAISFSTAGAWEILLPQDNAWFPSYTDVVNSHGTGNSSVSFELRLKWNRMPYRTFSVTSSATGEWSKNLEDDPERDDDYLVDGHYQLNIFVNGGVQGNTVSFDVGS